MPHITGHTELVGLMAYPIRHSGSPETHNLVYDINGDDVVQLAFEVDEKALSAAVESIRALRMLGSNISMPNKQAVLPYLDELDASAELAQAVNTVVNLRGEDGRVTGRLRGYNTDGMGYWKSLAEEGIGVEEKRLVLIGCGGAASAIAAAGASEGLLSVDFFNIDDSFFEAGKALAARIEEATNCRAEVHRLDDRELLHEKLGEADILCDATGAGMHPLEDLCNIPDASFLHEGLVVTDTVYVPSETPLLRMAREAGLKRVYNGAGMMLYQALTAIKLYTGKETDAALMRKHFGW